MPGAPQYQMQEKEPLLGADDTWLEGEAGLCVTTRAVDAHVGEGRRGGEADGYLEFACVECGRGVVLAVSKVHPCVQ